MMIHPSYSELMEVINKDQEQDDVPVVSSRYSVVLATSKQQYYCDYQKFSFHYSKEISSEYLGLFVHYRSHEFSEVYFFL